MQPIRLVGECPDRRERIAPPPGRARWVWVRGAAVLPRSCSPGVGPIRLRRDRGWRSRGLVTRTPRSNVRHKPSPSSSSAARPDCRNFYGQPWCAAPASRRLGPGQRPRRRTSARRVGCLTRNSSSAGTRPRSRRDPDLRADRPLGRTVRRGDGGRVRVDAPRAVPSPEPAGTARERPRAAHRATRGRRVAAPRAVGATSVDTPGDSACPGPALVDVVCRCAARFGRNDAQRDLHHAHHRLIRTLGGRTQ
jgi:hypothetical protein